MNRQAIGVHHRVNLPRQAPSRATHFLLIVVGDACPVLVHAHDRGIDHLHRRVMTVSTRGDPRLGKCKRRRTATGQEGANRFCECDRSGRCRVYSQFGLVRRQYNRITVFEYSISGKWLELLYELAPGLKRVAVVRDTSLAALAAGIGQFAAIQTMGSVSSTGVT